MGRTCSTRYCRQVYAKFWLEDSKEMFCLDGTVVLKCILKKW